MRALTCSLVVLLALGAPLLAAPTDITRELHADVFHMLSNHLATRDEAHVRKAIEYARKAKLPALVAYLDQWRAYDDDALALQKRVQATYHRARTLLARNDRTGARNALATIVNDIEAALPSPFAYSASRMLGHIQVSLGEIDAALRMFGQAEQAAETLGWKLGAFRAAHSIAKAYQTGSALPLAMQAIQRAHRHLRGLVRPREEAIAWLEQSGVESAMGAFEAASTSIEQAIVHAIAADDSHLLGNAYMSQGASYGKAGQPDLALHATLQAAQAFRAQKSWGGVVTATGNAIIFLGRLGRYGDALRHYEDLREELKQKGIAAPASMAVFLINVGSMYLHLGLNEEAVGAVAEALEIAKTVGDDAAVVRARGNLAIAHVQAGDHERALTIVDDLLQPAVRDRFPEEAAISYAVRALCLRKLGRLDEAAQTIQEAEARLSRDQAHHKASLNVERGEIALVRFDWHTALECFRRSAQQAEHVMKRGTEEAVAKGGMARALFGLDRYEESLTAAEQALAAYDLVGGSLAEREAVSFRQDAHHIGEIGILAALRWAQEDPSQHRIAIERAFASSERGRGRRIVAAIANPGALLADHVPAPLRKLDAQSIKDVEHARHELIAAMGAKDRAALTAARARLQDAWKTRREVIARVQREASRVAALVYPQPVLLPTLQGHLDECCALVSYHFLPLHAFAFVVTNEGADLIELGDAEPIRETVRQYVRLVSTPKTDETALAAALHGHLIEPCAKLLDGKSRLVVVADAELAFLPFGALIDGKTKKRLIEHLEIVATPSATAYDALLAGRSSKRGTGLLAIGDPSYPPLFEPLPGSRKEVAAVAATFPKSDRTTLLGTKATPDAIVRALAGRTTRLRALHLACHARVDPNHPRLSGLVLAGGEMLDLDRIFRTRIDADLAVLSACDSARGKTLEGIGTQGFVRGFLFAGTPRVVVSNWRVADQSTKDLMQAFYTAMQTGGMTPSAALRHAMRKQLARGGRTAHPYYWASFVLWGLPH